MIDVVPDYLYPLEFSKILSHEFYGGVNLINGYHRGVVHFVGSVFCVDIEEVSFIIGKWSISLVIHGDRYRGIDLVLEHFSPNADGARMAADLIKEEVDRRLGITSWVV